MTEQASDAPEQVPGAPEPDAAADGPGQSESAAAVAAAAAAESAAAVAAAGSAASEPAIEASGTGWPGPGRPADEAEPDQSGPERAAGRGAPGRSAPGPAAPGRTGPAGRSGPGRGGAPGGDLLTGLQRWLIRSSARNLRREVSGQVRKTLGGGPQAPGDVWSTATTEPPPSETGEAPECAWCPVCRAARRMRESRPGSGLGSQLAGAGDAVAQAVSDALEALDATLSRTGSAADPRKRQDEPDDRG